MLVQDLLCNFFAIFKSIGSTNIIHIDELLPSLLDFHLLYMPVIFFYFYIIAVASSSSLNIVNILLITTTFDLSFLSIIRFFFSFYLFWGFSLLFSSSDPFKLFRIPCCIAHLYLCYINIYIPAIYQMSVFFPFSEQSK